MSNSCLDYFISNLAALWYNADCMLFKVSALCSKFTRNHNLNSQRAGAHYCIERPHGCSPKGGASLNKLSNSIAHYLRIKLRVWNFKNRNLRVLEAELLFDLGHEVLDANAFPANSKSRPRNIDSYPCAHRSLLHLNASISGVLELFSEKFIKLHVAKVILNYIFDCTHYLSFDSCATSST